MFVSVVIYCSKKRSQSSGYSIRLFDGDAEIAYYSAGGHPCDSQAPGESPLSTVRKWARSSTNEMFAEYTGRLPKADEIEIKMESPNEE